MKYLLSLFILLLSVYSQLYARSYQDCNYHSTKSTFVRSGYASFGTAQNSQAQILKSVLYSTEKETCKIVAAEIEEEKHEWISFKKFLDNSNYFTTVFYLLAFAYLCLFLKNRLPSCKHSIYFSSYKWYILFRVIRIWFHTSGRHIQLAWPNLPLFL